MFENTRAAKRRRTSTYDPSPDSKDASSTAANEIKTPRRSLKRNQLLNGHSNDVGKAEQSDGGDEDELGTESTPISSRTTRRTARPLNPATPSTPADKVSATKISKNKKTRPLKAVTPNQKKSRVTIIEKSHEPIGFDLTDGLDFQDDVLSTIPAEEGKTVHKECTPSPVNRPGSYETVNGPNRVAMDDAVSHSPTDSLSSLAGPTLETLKMVVLEKLVGKRGNILRGLDDECQKVHSLLEQTITAGEGNSMLIIGARGTGKSTMINELLKKLSRENEEYFHTIRLNGFIQTDDNLALREIWRQLGNEMAVEEEGHARNYADTLATLLAILSHPTEISDKTNSDQVAKSVIFILDEFDLFASHPRQTLLYNLFDIAQSRKAPIAVLGLTSRVDIAENLEKRVKSRFSHRYVHLGRPNNLATFTETCRSVVQLQPEDLTSDEQLHLSRVPLETSLKRKLKTAPKPQPLQTILASWNESMNTLFHDPAMTHHLARIYHTTCSIPTALITFILPISQLSTESRFNLALHPSTLPPDSKLILLPSLPTLALSLLIATARLDIILDTDLCNFNMAYDEYVSLTSKARLAASATSSAVAGIAKVWSRLAARSMWEKLLELELLVRVSGGVGGAGAGGGGGVVVVSDTEMVKCDVALEEIEGSVPDLERGLEKWCREI